MREGVVRGTGADSSKDGRNKVANTALYVLMQRAIVPSLPLIGQGMQSFWTATFCVCSYGALDI